MKKQDRSSPPIPRLPPPPLLLPKKMMTRQREAIQAPEWKEDFVFNIADEKEELVVTLYDWDRTSKDDLIGCARVKVTVLRS